MWGRRELAAFGAALAVVIVVAVGYGLARGQRLGGVAPAGGDARVQRLAGPDGASTTVSDQERRAAVERLRASCRDLEVRLAYNGPLEARPAHDPGPAPTGGPCDRRELTDAEVLMLRSLPTPPPGEPVFADERELAEWKRDQLCGRPAPPGPADAALDDICAKPALEPAEIRALRRVYVEDPVAAERERLRREQEIANLTRTAAP